MAQHGQQVVEEVKQKKRKRLFLIAAIIVAVLLIVTGLSFCAMKKEQEVTFDKNVYALFDGIKVTVEAPSSVEFSDKGNTLKGSGSNTIMLDSRPMYIEGEKMAWFAEDVAIILPADNTVMKRIDAFSKVEVSDGLVTLTSRLGKSTTVSDGFIFDGGSNYLLLHPSTLTVGAESIYLGPLSSIQAEYNGSLVAYEYSKDESYYFDGSDVNAARVVTTSDQSKCEIVPAMDAAYVNGKKMLLLESFSSLKSVFD